VKHLKLIKAGVKEMNNKKIKPYIGLVGKSARSKEDLMDNIIMVADACKGPNNKRKYTLVQAKEIYIKIRELLE
tara:strand:+ start:469 stop:690 length:222 start_codon:yes stop_codon:yes gene_type:complete